MCISRNFENWSSHQKNMLKSLNPDCVSVFKTTGSVNPVYVIDDVGVTLKSVLYFYNLVKTESLIKIVRRMNIFRVVCVRKLEGRFREK